MRRSILLSVLLGIAVFGVHGQSTDYFQQEVHYDIAVTLNDSLHTLRGQAVETYINHSPDTLRELWYHLWPNAYQNRETAFARQQFRQGASRFYYADTTNLGGFTRLRFLQAGTERPVRQSDLGPDVVVVELAHPLLPGDSVVLDIPFTLDIPASYSRLGHVKESYQLTQWYPKPAVYDTDGWHPMPYLDQGEFYSEFGSFDVAITLPENYVVAATGVLQDSAEMVFLREREAADRAYIEKYDPQPIMLRFAMRGDTFPESADRMKTLHYQAEKVHDFAWFADKRFRVLSRKIELPSGREIDGYVFFTQVQEGYWKKSLDYLERATQFYSEAVGEYPWPQVTAVQSALSAGAGMEYPMITVIGLSGSSQALDEVITHEVGHNWFYGILGSNERAHPWMDEGLNSYYDHRYTEKYYGIPGGDYFLPDWLARHSDLPFYDLAYLYFARAGREEPATTESDHFAPVGYYLGAYEKPALAFRYLEAYWGKAKVDSAMQFFYQNWAFRHPGPADLQEAFESYSGENLDWLFSGLLQTTATVDYTIRQVREIDDSLRVLVENRGKIAAPLSVARELKGAITEEYWYPGFSGRRWVSLPAGEADALVIDPQGKTVDFVPNNNFRALEDRWKIWRNKKLLFGTGLPHSRNRHLYWLPLVGWNDYDKWMFGLGVHNYSIVEKEMEFALLPGYSFVSDRLVGMAQIQFNRRLSDSSPFTKFRLSGSHRRFAENYSYLRDYRLHYQRHTLAGELFLKPPSGTTQRRSFYLRADGVVTERPDFDLGTFTGILQDQVWFLGLGYRAAGSDATRAWQWQAGVEHKTRSDHAIGFEAYWKATAEFRFEQDYQRDRRIRMRVFGGGFLQHEYRDRNIFFPWSIDLTAQGIGDYRYEGYFLGRTDFSGIWWRQRSAGEGGFYSVLPPTYRTQSGTSNHFLIALNLGADLPRPLPKGFPFRPFINVAYSADRRSISGSDLADRLWWEAGVELSLLDGRLGVALPLFVSSNMRSLFDQSGQSGIFQRLSFTLDLHRFDPREIRESIGN